MKKNQKLLKEVFSYSLNYDKIPNLKQKLANDEPIFLESVIQRANSRNQNGRIYPKEVLKNAFDVYIKNFVNENRAISELDHPDSRAIVEFKTASHRINKIWWKGDDVWATIEILSGTHFPCANILRGCLKNNIPIGFSSRGMGSEYPINEDTVEIEDDLEIYAVDAVPNPSTIKAFGSLLENTKSYEQRNELNNILTELNTSIFKILG